MGNLADNLTKGKVIEERKGKKHAKNIFYCTAPDSYFI